MGLEGWLRLAWQRPRDSTTRQAATAGGGMMHGRLGMLLTATVLLTTPSLAQQYLCEENTICNGGGGCTNNVCSQRCSNLDGFCGAPCGCEGQPGQQVCFQGVCRCCAGTSPSCPGAVCDLGPREAVCASHSAPCGVPPNQVCCQEGFICNGGSCSPPPLGDGAVGRVVAIRGEVNVNGDPTSLGTLLHPGDSIFVRGLEPSLVVIFLAADARPAATLTLHAQSFIKLPPALPSPLDQAIRLERGLLESNVDRSKPATTKFEVDAKNSIIGVEGTIFTVEVNPDGTRDTVAVSDGIVLVTPKNPALVPFTLEAGHQVDVGPQAVGPILPCLPGQCDDGEACTTDVCTSAGCQNAPMTWLEAACSACQGGLGSGACAGDTVPPGIGKRIALACGFRDQAATNPEAAKKLLRRAKRALKTARTVARKAAKRPIDPLAADCAAAIGGALRPPL